MRAVTDLEFALLVGLIYQAGHRGHHPCDQEQAMTTYDNREPLDGWRDPRTDPVRTPPRCCGRVRQLDHAAHPRLRVAVNRHLRLTEHNCLVPQRPTHTPWTTTDAAATHGTTASAPAVVTSTRHGSASGSADTTLPSPISAGSPDVALSDVASTLVELGEN